MKLKSSRDIIEASVSDRPFSSHWQVIKAMPPWWYEREINGFSEFCPTTSTFPPHLWRASVIHSQCQAGLHENNPSKIRIQGQLCREAFIFHFIDIQLLIFNKLFIRSSNFKTDINTRRGGGGGWKWGFQEYVTKIQD